MRACRWLFLPLLVRATVAPLSITGFSAAVDPDMVQNGAMLAFCSFIVTVPGAMTGSNCYSWATSSDQMLPVMSSTSCSEDPSVLWSLNQAVSDEGEMQYVVNFAWKDTDSHEWCGTHLISPDDVQWADAEGQTVQCYVGSEAFSVPLTKTA